jgi:hypothetical protein
MIAKYICIDYPIKGEAIIIFPEMLVHKDVARNNAHAGCKIISAGFVTFVDAGHFICHGESESLGIKSRPEQDSELVNFMFGRV